MGFSPICEVKAALFFRFGASIASISCQPDPPHPMERRDPSPHCRSWLRELAGSNHVLIRPDKPHANNKRPGYDCAPAMTRRDADDDVYYWPRGCLLVNEYIGLAVS